MNFIRGYQKYSIIYWRTLINKPINIVYAGLGGALFGLNFERGATSYIIDPTPEESEYIRDSIAKGCLYGACLGPLWPLIPPITLGMVVYYKITDSKT